jgi:hypothetical protein
LKTPSRNEEERNQMKKISFLLLLITPLIMTTSLHAITYPFPENEPAYLNDEAVMKVGTKIYLFHNGMGEVRKTINVNDVLTVYREYPADFSLESREIGKVRILSALGEYYFEAEVVEGYVQPGNVAIKGSVACYVTAFKKRSHQ